VKWTRCRLAIARLLRVADIRLVKASFVTLENKGFIMIRSITVFVVGILLVACGAIAISEGQTDVAVAPNDASVSSDSEVAKWAKKPPSTTYCWPKGGTVITNQIDASSCIPDGGTCGDLTCYTLAETCAFCCVCRE
jgi:hypothetical protein